jgi:hypothetical protein
VPRYAGKTHVSARELKIRVAHAGHSDADERLARPPLRSGLMGRDAGSFPENERKHACSFARVHGLAQLG